MPYRFALERDDYSDLAAGKVFESVPDSPSFPVRLASEILQRCIDIRSRAGITGRVTLYDPCCGTAYLLGTLAYLHWTHLDQLIGSDIDSAAVALASRNLALLTPEGLDRRIERIESLITRFGKASHTEALESAKRLKSRLGNLRESHPVTTTLLVADALDADDIVQKMAGNVVDVVITDVPYGRLSAWQSGAPAAPDNAIARLLESIRPILKPQAVVAICADKQQKVSQADFRRVDHFQIGKRRVTLLMASQAR